MCRKQLCSRFASTSRAPTITVSKRRNEDRTRAVCSWFGDCCGNGEQNATLEQEPTHEQGPLLAYGGHSTAAKVRPGQCEARALGHDVQPPRRVRLPLRLVLPLICRPGHRPNQRRSRPQGSLLQGIRGSSLRKFS